MKLSRERLGHLDLQRSYQRQLSANLRDVRVDPRVVVVRRLPPERALEHVDRGTCSLLKTGLRLLVLVCCFLHSGVSNALRDFDGRGRPLLDDLLASFLDFHELLYRRLCERRRPYFLEHGRMRLLHFYRDRCFLMVAWRGILALEFGRSSGFHDPGLWPATQSRGRTLLRETPLGISPL